MRGSIAAAKALFFLLIISPVFGLISCCLPKRIVSSRSFAQDSRPLELSFWWGSGWSIVQLFICTAGTVATLTGLVRPLFKPNSMEYFQMVWARYLDSLGLTLFYGTGSAAVATVFGFLVASYFFVQKHHKLQKVTLLLLAVCFVMPSSITALGIALSGTQLPVWSDFLFRSEWVVILTMGIRFAPIAALFYFLGYSLMPSSLSEVHHLTKPDWLFFKINLQFLTLWQWGLLSFVVTSVLTLADVGAVTLVQPPGGSSFSAYFFGSMDNSPEVLVSSMCVVYMAAPLMVLGALGMFYGIGSLSRPFIQLIKHDTVA